MLTDEAAFLKKENASLKALASSLLQSLKTLNRLGQARPDENELEEVAVGRGYRLSSCYFGDAGRSGLVGTGTDDFFFHTNAGVDEFITIDLGRPRIVRLVVVVNRLLGCPERARLLFITLHDSPDDRTGAVFPVDSGPGFSTGAASEARTAIPAVTARYLSIGSPLCTYLHFSAVRVFAEPETRGGSDAHRRSAKSETTERD